MALFKACTGTHPNEYERRGIGYSLEKERDKKNEISIDTMHLIKETKRKATSYIGISDKLIYTNRF